MDLIEKSNAASKVERAVFIVTGLSGAGKSVTLRALEDQGFFCVDNLPIPLLSTFLNFVSKQTIPSSGQFGRTILPAKIAAGRAEVSAVTTNSLSRVALGIDIRGGTFFKDFMCELKKAQFDGKIIFLDAKDETIIKRFQETRRAHPLAKNISVSSAIKKEREILAPIKELATEIHCTDESSIHELRRWVKKTFASGFVQKLVVNVISFGFKYGVPAESNLVYDLRFLPNPYFVKDLKRQNGTDLPVQKYLFDKEEVETYWKKLKDFLMYVLGCYYKEGRFFANVAIGCTGGKHRSVAFVERLCKECCTDSTRTFLAHHRDLGKE